MNKWNLRSLDLKRSQMRTNFLINSLNIVVHTRGNRRSRLISVDNHHSGVYLVQKQEEEEEKQRQEEGKKRLKVAGEKVLRKWKKQLMKKRLQQEQPQGGRKDKDEVKSRDAFFSPFESNYKGQLSRSSSRQPEQEQNHLKTKQKVGDQLNRGCSQVIGEQEQYNLEKNKRTIEYSEVCSRSSKYEKGKEKDGAEGEKEEVNGQKYRRVQSNRVPSQSQQEQHSHGQTDIKKQRNSNSLTHLQQYQKYGPHPKGYIPSKGQYQTLQQSSRNSNNQHLNLKRRKINNQKGSRNILTTQQNGIRIVLSVGKKQSNLDKPQKQQQTNRITVDEPSVDGNITSVQNLKHKKVPIRLPEVRSISYSQSLQGHSISLSRSIKSINNSIRKSLGAIEQEGQVRQMHDWKIQQRKRRIRLEEGEDQSLPELSEQEKKEQMVRKSLGGQGQNKQYFYDKGKVFSNLLPQSPSQISLGHQFTPKGMPSFIAIPNNINPQKKAIIGRYRTSPREEEGRLSPWPVAKETILGSSFKKRI